MMSVNVSPLQLNVTHRRTTITKISPPRSQNPPASARLPALVSPPVVLRPRYFRHLPHLVTFIITFKDSKATTRSNGEGFACGYRGNAASSFPSVSAGFNCRVQRPRGPRDPPAGWSRLER